MIVLLEGMDKVGKSTVASYYCKQYNCQYIHMSAPASGTTKDEYILQMVDIIAGTHGKNVVFDRTWYGELVWPHAYSRTSLLDAHACNVLTRLAEKIHDGQICKIYMYDPNKEDHQARMREFKEPSYNYDLVSGLYSQSMTEAGFSFLTFKRAEDLGWTK